MKILFFVLIAIIAGQTAYSQKTLPDTEKYAPCELFAQKSGYDWQQRLAQIDSLENQELSVFEVKGKDNHVTSSYTGKVVISAKNSGKARTKGNATVVTVVEDMGNGQMRAHFPLTNDKNYRIYLKSCLK